MGTVALLSVLLALALVVTWLASWPILGIWRAVTSLRPRWSRWNLAVLSLPLFIGGMIAVGAAWPASTLELSRWTCHCDPASLFHLCVAHPNTALPVLPLAAFALVWMLWRPARTTAEVIRRLRAARSIVRASPLEAAECSGVQLADLGTPNAFTVGLFSPMVVVDRLWWRSLAPTEQRIVAAHETAHVRCKDPLSHTVGLLLSGLCASALGDKLVTDWLAWAEQRADGHAADAIDDPAAVATLLVQQKRAERVQLSLVPSFGGGGLEKRVLAVLAGESVPRRLGSRVGLSLAIALILWTTGVTLFGYPIHIAVEHLLQALT